MRDLTKWPRLLVVGETVTEEQAREILVRTVVPGYLRGNDRGWDDAVAQVMGFPRGEDWPEHGSPEDQDTKLRMAWFRARWSAIDTRAQELGVIPLNYLYNSRITSTWIGGSFGWCDWSGKIACSTFNIGKWPSHEDITNEWTRIARAFPFLRLKSQLIADEGEGEIAGQWHVRDGVVTEEPVGELLTSVDEITDEQVLHRMTSGTGERGVSLELLALAVREVEAKQKTTPAITSGTKEIES